MSFPRIIIFGVLASLNLCPIADAHCASTTRPTAPRVCRTNLLLLPRLDGSYTDVGTINDWQKRRTLILEAMQRVMGPLPGNDKRCALEPTVIEETDCGDYVRRLLIYSSEPGSKVPAYLLIPKRVLLSLTRQAPAVLALHQTHSAGQKVVVGLANSPNDAYGVELVQRGFVVLAPPYTMLADYWPDLKALGYQSGTMKSVWDNIRAIDYLLTLPFVQTNGVAVIGHSLGGHNGVFSAVFDERIKVVVTSCGLDSFVDYKDGDITGWAQERYMPKLKEYVDRPEEIPFDFPELIAALAPRVCLISAPLGDSNFKWRSVDSVAASARPIFALHGVSKNLRVEHPACGHLFPAEMRERAYQLIEETFNPK